MINRKSNSNCNCNNSSSNNNNNNYYSYKNKNRNKKLYYKLLLKNKSKLPKKFVKCINSNS